MGSGKGYLVEVDVRHISYIYIVTTYLLKEEKEKIETRILLALSFSFSRERERSREVERYRRGELVYI
tara:strand:+ start:204 stop:407 length:204 start_codon:yes stop_codon:yes gene_type:complete